MKTQQQLRGKITELIKEANSEECELKIKKAIKKDLHSFVFA